MARENLKDLRSFFVATALLACLLGLSGSAAAQMAQPPYQLSVFAKSVTGMGGYTQPDSIVQWRNSVIIGFGNGVAKDGTDGKSSTIVQYSLKGKVERMFSVTGHNDGLRIIGEDDLWALQNEDGNPSLVVIELESGHMKTYTFAPTVHGGGFDDIAVKGETIFLSASNPNLTMAGVNVFPAIVRAHLSGDMVEVDGVVNGDASATDIPTGMAVTLNLTDPDSMTIDPRGNIVLTSQADGVLAVVHNPLSATPDVGRLVLTKPDGTGTTVDDTTFAPSGKTFLLITDISGGTIYRLDSAPFGFEPGTAYSASDSNGLVGTLNLDNGVVTPVVTGLKSPRGLLFVVHSERHERHGHDR